MEHLLPEGNIKKDFRGIFMMNGIERMKRIYKGYSDVVPVYLFFSTEYMCLQSGVPDYKFLYGPHEYRAKAMIAMTKIHNIDILTIWTRGKRKDWLKDYQLVENSDEIYIWDSIKKRKLKLSEDYYAIDFPEEPPLRFPYIEYGENQELIKGKPIFSNSKFNIQTKEDVDRLLPLETAKQVIDGGMFEEVKLVSQAIGKKIFLEANCNAPFRWALGLLGEFL